jgi:hypothetical protein
VHALLQIREITFVASHPVEKDTTGNFPSPEWVRGRAASGNSPVCYTRNTRVYMTAKFEVTRHPTAPETAEVRGRGTFGSATLEWVGVVSIATADAEVTVSGLASATMLPDQVACYDPVTFNWEANPASTGWAAAGSSSHLIYVLLGSPSGVPAYWTLLDISCRGAAGKSTEDDFVKASFDPFRGTLGNGKGFKRKRDGVELTYYKMGAGTPASGVFSCSDILSRADGTGRCGGWADLMVAMHHVHGVTSSAMFGVQPVSASLLIVKNCTFAGAGSRPVPFTHKGQTECVKSDGIFGQGKDNPQFTFGDHALVKHSTGIYDPSYGVGPKADLKTWEDGGIAGIGEGPPYISFTYKGDAHFFPGECSRGFIIHTVVAGDTLASIAKKYGVATETVLFNHPYNAALRKLRPPPAKLSVGDHVYVPRDIATKVAILKVI